MVSNKNLVISFLRKGILWVLLLVTLGSTHHADAQSYQVDLQGEIYYQYILQFDVPTDSFALAARSWMEKQRESNEPILVTDRDSIKRYTMETYQNVNMQAKTRKGTPKTADTLTRVWYKVRIYIKDNKCKMIVSDFRTGRHGDNRLSERLVFPTNSDVYRYEWLSTIEDLKDYLFKRFEADVKSRSVLMQSEWEF